MYFEFFALFAATMQNSALHDIPGYFCYSKLMKLLIN